MIELKKYQQEGVNLIDYFKGKALLADDMGLGKNIQSLAWLQNHPEIRPAVVVCPCTVKWVWQVQAKMFKGLRGEVLEGTKPPLNPGIVKHHSILILNYEILQYWIDHLKELKPQALIVDECHYIKSRSAQRTKAIRQLAKRIPNIIATSGTPLLNRPAELFTILNLIRPDCFSSFFPFAMRYCNLTRSPWGWEYKGATNIPELHRRIKKLLMIRRRKKDVLKELPDKTRIVLPLDIKQREKYEEATNNFITWLYKKSVNKANKAMRAQKLTQMGYLKRLAAKLKMRYVFEWIDNFLNKTDEKLVLFCIHKKIIKRLHKRYHHISVVVDGGVIGRKRKLAIKSFQTNRHIKLFIGNIRAAGLGIDLWAASHLAFIELDWVPGLHTQAEDRIHRIGQKNACTIYYLIAKDTIEEHLCKIIQRKQAVIISALDGKNVKNELNIFSMLEKKLRRNKNEQ